MNIKVLFGEVNVGDEFKSDSISVISSRYVVDLENPKFAAMKAVDNWRKGYRISKSPALEVLLYHSATRQIKDAIRTAAKGKERAAIVILDDREFDRIKDQIEFKETEFKPEYDLKEIMEIYDITREELEIVGYEKLNLLVRERIALFSVSRDVK